MQKSLVEQLKDTLSKPLESFMTNEKLEDEELYKLTHSNCCDALIIMVSRCAKCGESCVNQI